MVYLENDRSKNHAYDPSAASIGCTVYSRADLVRIGHRAGYGHLFNCYGLTKISLMPRRHGRRGGSRKQRHIHVVDVNKRNQQPTQEQRHDHMKHHHRNLIIIDTGALDRHHPVDTRPSKASHCPASFLASLYVLKVNFLAKPHARDQLHADLIDYNTDVAIISETNLKRTSQRCRMCYPRISDYPEGQNRPNEGWSGDLRQRPHK